MACGFLGSPAWNHVNGKYGACNGDCKGGGINYAKPVYLYLVGGYVKKAGPSLKPGVTQEGNEHRRFTAHANNGLDRLIACSLFDIGYEAASLEKHLKALIKDGPGNLRSWGVCFDGSTEAFELNAADDEFLAEFLACYGITDVPLYSLWTDENYERRFAVWAGYAA
jgi:hypothetical protein